MNILVHEDSDFRDQMVECERAVASALLLDSLDAIICVTGSAEYGGIDDSLPEVCEKMWKQNVWPAVTCANIAKKHLKPGGFLCLSGREAYTKS